jgi:hypothetical protein
MSSQILTREEVAQKLRDWAEGRSSTEEIQSWATSAYMNDEVDFADWEKDDDSVTKEVVAALDMLDMNLVLPEDAPIYLEFLDTPIGGFAAGYAKLQGRVDAIDYEKRRVRLRDVEPYAPFLSAPKKAPNSTEPLSPSRGGSS